MRGTLAAKRVFSGRWWGGVSYAKAYGKSVRWFRRSKKSLYYVNLLYYSTS